MKTVAWLIGVGVVLACAGCRPTDTPAVDGLAEPPPDAARAPAETVLRLAYVSTDGELRLVDPETMAQTVALTGLGDHVSYSAGSALVYVDESDTIHRADLATGEDTVIATAADPYMRTFTISPDGARVAIVEGEGLSVWEGGRMTAIAGPRPSDPPAWSPDSTRLAVGARGEDESEDGGLWLWEGGPEARRIVPPVDEGWGSTREIMWSPDAAWLAWARGAGDGWTGDLCRADGSDLKRDAIGAGPLAWLPDASGLLMSIHIEAGAFGAGLYRLADGSLTRIGPEYWDSRAALSPDGAQVLAFGSDGRAIMADVATGEQRAWGEGMSVQDAVWAPDGRLALALGELAGGGGELWIGRPDGTEIGRKPLDADWWWNAQWLTLPADAAALKQ